MAAPFLIVQRVVSGTCWSSSFSACTVPNRRQASTLPGCRCTSASRASTASDRSPFLKSSFPRAKLSKS